MEVLIDEAQRLRVLNSYAILDTASEEDFDELTRLAALLCETPVSLITFTAEDRVWVKSAHGITLDEVPREGAFCAHAVEHPHEPLIIADARTDARFANCPLVIDSPFVVFYAGVVLFSPEGYSIGTFSVIDTRPRTLSEVQLKALQTLSHQASKLLDLRKKTRELEREKSVFEAQSALFRKTSRVARIDLWEIDLVKDRVYLGEVIKQIHEAPTLDDVLTLDDLDQYYLEGKDRSTMFAAMDRAIRHGHPFDVEVRIRTFTGRIMWVRVTGEADMSRGRCLRIYGTFQDIDEHVQTRHKLEESQKTLRQEANFYKSIIENQSFYILKIDLAGNYTFMNDYYCEHFGFERSKKLGTSAIASVVEEDQPVATQALINIVNQPNGSHRALLRKYNPRGLEINNWDFTVLTDEQGNIAEIVCIGYDVTDLIEKQQQLQTLADVTAEQNKRLIKKLFGI